MEFCRPGPKVVSFHCSDNLSSASDTASIVIVMLSPLVIVVACASANSQVPDAGHTCPPLVVVKDDFEIVRVMF